jgi:hypothetical protein
MYATLSSSLLLGSLFVSLPVLNNLNIFSDANTQPDTPGIYTVVETVLAGAAFLISAVALWTVVGKKRKIDPERQKLSGFFFIAFTLAEVVILVARLYWSGILTDIKLLSKVGCRDISFDGNPIARYEHYANDQIKLASECTFNAFNVDNINGGNVLDWSNHINYDAENRGVLLQAITSSGLTDIGMDDVPYYYHYWYWGCSSVCHERFKLNRSWMFISMFAFFSYLTLALLFYCSAGARSSIRAPAGQTAITKQTQDDSPETEPLIDDELEEIQTAPDEESDEEFAGPSSNRPSRSEHDPSYSRKVRFRM